MDPTTPLVSPFQILSLSLFLGGLGLLWLYVQKNKAGLIKKVGQGRRIAVMEVSSLSTSDRAMILKVDAQDFLVLKSKGEAPVVVRLGELNE